MTSNESMFTTSGRDRAGYADRGAPRKAYCSQRPAMSTDPDDWKQFRTFVEGRCLEYKVAKINAWYPSRNAGDSSLRVVIPATSRNTHNLFWQARNIDGDPTAKRYQSPHAARGDALVITNPLDEELCAAVGTVLVEGPFDALAASEAGFVGVALLGNTPSEEALEHAAEWLVNGPPALAVLDLDAIPLGADLVRKLLTQYGVASLLARSPYPYKDLADMPRKERHALLWGKTPLPLSDGGYAEDMG